ncbi:MAG: hypothetical protein ACUZ77_03970 [Candidatus Brocadiales bacterium]
MQGDSMTPTIPDKATVLVRVNSKQLCTQ